MATAQFVRSLSIIDSTRISRAKPVLFSFSIRESRRNVYLHARDNHLGYALCPKRRISDIEAIIIPRKIRTVLPQILPLSRVEMPEAPLHRRVLRLHWSDRTGNRNKIVIGGVQRSGKLNSKLKG